MWSDNDIDNAFQRLNPPEPEPTPFPLDAWLRLESELDKAVIERAVRQRLWQFFAAAIAVVLLFGLGWLLWPTAAVPTTVATTLASRTAALSATSAPAAGHLPKGVTAASPAASASTSSLSKIPSNTDRVKDPEAAASAATSGLSQSSSTASPTASPDAVATGAATVSRPTKVQPIAVLLVPARTGYSRTRLANAEYPARQQGSASNFLGTNGVRKAVLRSRERIALAGRHAVAGASNEAAATAALVAGTQSESQATGLNSPAAYAVVAEVRKPTNAHSLSTRTTNATEAADAATAGSASTQPGAAANTATDGFATLALRPVLAAPAESAPLPMPLAMVALVEMPPQPEVPKPAREPRFYVALVGAPDVSTVKFASIGKTMANVGLLLEYRLTSRLRVNTGLLRADKRYTARREDYDFGPNTARVYQRDFTDVEGSCTVLDVPLNLRYDLFARPRYRVFGSAGLSSFLMQREDYSYEYPNPTTGVPSYWTGSATNQNRHYLSILNLSAGYERSLNAHWSLQAEPYLKLPLAGVGSGKLRLTSAGVFFGVKYGL